MDNTGFWSEKPHLHHYSSHIYDVEKVILYRHLVVNDSEPCKSYHFWTSFFSHDDLASILKENNFRIISFNDDVLADTDQWNGKNVTFTVSGII